MRIFRTKEQILGLLEDQQKSNLSVKIFCEQSGISNATFFNWRKKFGGGSHGQSISGFASLQATHQMPSAPRLFAEAGGIKIYQFVDAAYLKELIR